MLATTVFVVSEITLTNPPSPVFPLKFVAKISGEIVAHFGSSQSRDGERRAQTTPDGRYLIFSAGGSLAGDLNGSGAQAVYRYDFATGQLTWISHGAPHFKAENEGQASARHRRGLRRPPGAP